MCCSEANGDFARYLRFYQTQVNTTTCALASAAMVLNTLDLEAPLVTEFYPARFFTQMNIMNAEAQQVVSYRTIQRKGMTLSALEQLLIHGWSVTVERYTADKLDLEDFRALMLQALNSDSRRVIANYEISTLGLSEKKIGHFSPVAAYERQSDRFLVLDVARYLINPFWVTSESLFEAMQTIDSESGDNRGLLVVSEGYLGDMSNDFC